MCAMCKASIENASSQLCNSCETEVKRNEDAYIKQAIHAIKTENRKAFRALLPLLPHLSKPKDPHAVGHMPMHEAAKFNSRLPFAMDLLNAGHRVDQRDRAGGYTPVMWAVAFGASETLGWLLTEAPHARATLDWKLGEDVAIVETGKSIAGWTALHCAAHYNCRECNRVLVELGADEFAIDDDGQTPEETGGSQISS